MHLALLTTGRMEIVGLPCALRRLFPEHTFTSIPRTVGSTDPFDGFTSAKLPLNNAKAPSSLDKLVQAMVAHLVPGRRGNPPDVLIVVDDLELANADQPDVVVSEFRKAVARHFERLEATNSGLAARVRQALTTRASFHFAVPMAESWLFADPAGPANAGAPQGHLPAKLTNSCDPELFETNDVSYTSDDGSNCTCWADLSEAQQKKKRKTHKPEWLKAEPRRRPKSYLAWLCRDRAAKKCSTYRETSSQNGMPTGASALASLDWGAALHKGEHCQYLRALVEDIADALGETVQEPMKGSAAPLTSRHHLPSTPLLRNL